MNAIGFLCGGSIISSSFVLTSAHCTFNKPVRSMTIHAGSIFHSIGGITKNIQAKYEHPLYDDKTSDYDFSLLHLDSELKFSNTIQLIRMQLPNSKIDDNINCTVTHSEKTSASGSRSHNLRLSGVKTVTKYSCIRNYGQHITDQMVCAENHDRSSCSGKII